MGTWSEIQVSGHACDVFTPSKTAEPQFVVIYLHGVHLNRLTDKPEFSALFEHHGLHVIAPITQRSWWTDRICPEFDPAVTAERHILDNVLSYVQQTWGVTPPAIALLGTSMGGQGALRLAFKHPDTFPVVAALSPAIDYHLKWDEGDETLQQMYPDPETARQDTATLHIHPLYWPRNIFFCCDPSDSRWHESADRLRMKLAALGVPFECDLESPGGGHGFPYYNAMAPAAMKFISERLEAERRRQP